MKPAVNYNRFVELQGNGRTGKNLLLIEQHVCDIPQRIRLEMGDPKWFVCRNPEESRWEVHYDGKARETLEVVVPFEELDSRIIDYLRRNRAENAKQILRDIVASNERMVSAKNNKRHEYAGAVIDDAIDYMAHHPTKDLKMDEVRSAMTGTEGV